MLIEKNLISLLPAVYVQLDYFTYSYLYMGNTNYILHSDISIRYDTSIYPGKVMFQGNLHACMGEELVGFNYQSFDLDLEIIPSASL